VVGAVEAASGQLEQLSTSGQAPIGCFRIYNARWHCPLAPTESRLSAPVRAGERERP
jgi:hypothetical protein